MDPAPTTGLLSGEVLGKDAETNEKCCYCFKVPLGFFVYGILTAIGCVYSIINSFKYFDESVVYAIMNLAVSIGFSVGEIYFIFKQRTSADDFEGRSNLVKCCNLIIIQPIVMIVILVLYCFVFAGAAGAASGDA